MNVCSTDCYSLHELERTFGTSGSVKYHVQVGPLALEVQKKSEELSVPSERSTERERCVQLPWLIAERRKGRKK